jgi:hypothetical protein
MKSMCLFLINPVFSKWLQEQGVCGSNGGIYVYSQKFNFMRVYYNTDMLTIMNTDSASSGD